MVPFALTRLVRCSASLDVADTDPLPAEFRLFHAGVNESAKGPAIFDAQAAADVMADFQRSAVDQMVDLEHDSLSPETRMLRSDAADARGWYRLEVRPGPELWAVGVRWTDDVAARIRTKRQRYISPAFRVHSKTHRVVSVHNVALVARPATFGAEPLIAASIGDPRETKKMNPETIKKAIEALKSEDAKAALAILEEMVMAAATGEEAPAEPSTDDAALGSAEAPPPALGAPEDKALSRELSRLTGKQSAGEIVDVVRSMATRLSAIEADRAALDNSARVELVGELVKLGAETPATAWQGDVTRRIPVLRLASESVLEMRSRVTALRATRPASVNAPEAETIEFKLSAADEAAASTMTPAQRAKFVALRRERSAK
jgi:phage I-like protein